MEQKRNSFKFTKKAKIFTAVVLIVLTVFTGVAVMTEGRMFKGLTLGSIVMGSANLKALPAVQSYSDLEKLLEEFYPKNMRDNMKNGMMGMARGDAMLGAGETASKSSISADTASNAVGYSTTNVQVQGVDEGDSVKTDGEYIYKIFHGTGSETGVQIIKAYPGENLQVISNIKLQDAYPSQIFLRDNHLVVIGSCMRKYPQAETTSDKNASAKSVAADILYMPMNNTAAFVYDIKDRNNPKLVRDMEIDGSFTTARMIGSNVYVIANKYIYPVWYMEGDHKRDILPVYRDSAAGKDYKTLELKDIRYCPEALEPNFIMVASFNLDKINEQLNVTSTLGSGHNIFCSTDNLYIAGYNYKADNSYNTTIYKFSLKNGKITFTASGEVPGSILNQFSMDEHNGYFRVTTTSHPVNGNWNNDSVNNIYVLDKDIKLTGKVEGLAKGERIYSTRFMGDRAYMVTFRNTDPLYVIDMKNPAAPKVLGELKIPGFSNYLHPYDENHIIGFGKDAEVVNMNDRETALQQGIKLAIFDVSDVNNPKQKFMEVIGDRGTDSELLYNHKALLFSKENNLLAFPITVAEIKNDPKNTDPKAASWGMPTFVGAYVYGIDLQKGFTLRGKISHVTVAENDLKRYYDWNGAIQRVLYIKDNLYTVSENMIKANKLTDLKEIGSLNLK